ncbi:MAG: pilin [Candidatus Paceibacterota bacterium]
MKKINKQKFLLLFFPSSLFLLTCILQVRAATLPNPITEDSFTKLIQNSLSWLLSISGSIAFLMLIWGGIAYITSSGDSQKAEYGKKIITWTIFGLVIIFLSYSIISTLEKIFVE